MVKVVNDFKLKTSRKRKFDKHKCRWEGIIRWLFK